MSRDVFACTAPPEYKWQKGMCDFYKQKKIRMRNKDEGSGLCKSRFGNRIWTNISVITQDFPRIRAPFWKNKYGV